MKTSKQHLHLIIQHLLGECSPTAGNRSNLLQNHVPEDMEVKGDVKVISSVIKGLLHAVISNAKGSCIRVTAKTYHNVVLLHVKDSSSYNNYAVTAGLQKVQPLAEQVGGFLEITSQRQLETTIAFSFMNVQRAAA